jgi:hypothetical protein
MKVNVNELRAALNYLATINVSRLADIEWVDDNGVAVIVDYIGPTIEDWLYTGLSNTTFAEFHVLQDKCDVE